MTKPIKDAIGKIALPALVLPPGPHVVRNAAGAVESVTDAGLAAIEHMARVGCTQETIASEFGMGAKAFAKLLGKADIDPVSAMRLAWEKGFAAHKSDLIRGLTAQAEKGSMIPGIFLLKGLHQLRDQGAQVEIKNQTSFIQFIPPGTPNDISEAMMKAAASEGVMLLPRAHSDKDSYYASIGMTGPDDTRTPEKKAELQLLLGHMPVPVEPAPTIKDVTPAKPEPEPSPTGPTEADCRAHGFSMVQWQTNCENARRVGAPLPPMPAPLPEGPATPAPKIEPVHMELTTKNGQAIGPNFNRTASY